MKIALVSLNQAWENKEKNFLLCDSYIQKASNQKVDLIVFPEMTLTGFSTNIEKIAENEITSETIEKISKLAKINNIAIIFGVVIEENTKASNRAYFVDKNGELSLFYKKIHPFSFAGEDRYFIAGNEIKTLQCCDVKIGLSICYDLRFPELYSALAKECDVIVNIANWPEKRIDHWNTLLKARAIENQIFVIGVNRTGEDGNDLAYVESSTIFNANGECIEYNAKIDDMKIYEIDKSWTENFRNNFSTVQDRKTDLYKKIV